MAEYTQTKTLFAIVFLLSDTVLCSNVYAETKVGGSYTGFTTAPA